jgi:mitochondrial import receptor subunit TOM40
MEKPPSESTSSSWGFLTSNPVITKASEYISAFQKKREDLGLSYPGTIEQISKEVDRDVLLNNYAFSGLRADISKTLSPVNPLFTVSHQFATGSQSQFPYTLVAMYGSPKVFG